MKPTLPGAILEPLRSAFRADPNVVRAWWQDGRVLVALDDTGGDVDDYRACLQDLSAAVLPLLGPVGASLGCGPAAGIAPSARGGTLVYERDET